MGARRGDQTLKVLDASVEDAIAIGHKLSPRNTLCWQPVRWDCLRVISRGRSGSSGSLGRNWSEAASAHGISSPDAFRARLLDASCDPRSAGSLCGERACDHINSSRFDGTAERAASSDDRYINGYIHPLPAATEQDAADGADVVEVAADGEGDVLI